MDTINNLSSTDLRFVVSRIPRDIRKLMMENTGLILAGGFIRETISQDKPNDIDLFAFGKGNNDQAKEFLRLLSEVTAAKRNVGVYRTGNAFSVFTPTRMPVQFIHRWTYGLPLDVINSLDFTVCQAAVWFEKLKEGEPEASDFRRGAWKSLVSPSFYPDLAARRLVYTNPSRDEEAGGSMLRVRKFIKRGFNIQCESLAGVITRLVFGVREDSRAWRDPAQMRKVFTGLLKEVDPNIAIDGLEPIDEHQTIEELSTPLE